MHLLLGGYLKEENFVTQQNTEIFHSNDHKYFNLPILSSSDVVVDVLLTETVCVEIDVEWMIVLVDD